MNKLLEDGNTLFRNGRYDAAAYRYEYALKRIPRLKPCDTVSQVENNMNDESSKLKNLPKQRNREKDDVFAQLKSHLLLNLSRTKRKQGVCDFLCSREMFYVMNNCT